MRALVTGADGFVGRWLVHHLSAQGDEVVAIDRESSDIRDAAAVALAVRDARPETVYHLAAQSSVARSFGAPIETFEVNVLGTLAVLEAIREHAPRSRVVVASSAEVYGSAPVAELPLTESSPLRPSSPYSSSKVAQEVVALQYHRAFGVGAVVVRSFNAVGPGQSPSFALPSFARQLASIAREEAPPVLRVGNLEARRDLTDVRDVVKAYRLVALGADAGEVLNICSGRAVSIRQALDMLVATSGLEVEVIVDPDNLRPNDVPVLVGSGERLRRATGWAPEIPLLQSLADLYSEQNISAH